MKNTHKSIFYFLYISIIFLLLISFIIFVLEKQQIIDLYKKPISQTENTPRPINDVDYGPPAPLEEQQAQDIKKEVIQQSGEVESIPQGIINVSLSAATQDVPGGPLEVRAIIVGATTGTCTLSLSQNGNVKTFTANIINLGNYYGCEGFSVPVLSLSAGNWLLELIVANDSAKGSVKQEVTIN